MGYYWWPVSRGPGERQVGKLHKAQRQPLRWCKVQAEPSSSGGLAELEELNTDGTGPSASL